MKICDVEKEVGITIKNIRFYEDKGLLQIKRSKNGYRDFSREDVERLKAIKYLRQLKFSIKDIHAYFQKQIDFESFVTTHIEHLKQIQEESVYAIHVCEKMLTQKTLYVAYEEEKIHPSLRNDRTCIHIEGIPTKINLLFFPLYMLISFGMLAGGGSLLGFPALLRDVISFVGCFLFAYICLVLSFESEKTWYGKDGIYRIPKVKTWKEKRVRCKQTILHKQDDTAMYVAYATISNVSINIKKVYNPQPAHNFYRAMIKVDTIYDELESIEVNLFPQHQDIQKFLEVLKRKQIRLEDPYDVCTCLCKSNREDICTYLDTIYEKGKN